MKRQRGRIGKAGLGPAEVIVIVLIVGVLILLLMMGLTRSREVARSVTCQQNLKQIGIAMGLYETIAGQLPPVPELSGVEAEAEEFGPLALMLEQIGVSRFSALVKGKVPTPDPAGALATERYVPGFVCPADPIATARTFPAPVNYRANAGDTTDGRHGPFSPGATVTRAEVEAGDGLSYTAAFAERLVGSAGTSENQRLRNYTVVPGPISADRCPVTPDESMQDDAGRSWREIGWRSTLYNHAMTPGAVPSCISRDGRTARMGTSSGHVAGVQVLMMDGSVQSYEPGVDARIWAGLGGFRSPDTDAATPPEPEPETEPEVVEPDDSERTKEIEEP